MMNYIFQSNIINFIIVVVFFIWLLFYKLDVIGMLDKKSQETKNIIEKSENKKSDAIKFLEETKNGLKNVGDDINKILDDAKETAKNIEEKSKIKLNEEIETIKARADILKISHENKAKEEISQKISTAAIAISKKYIENSLDENLHKELIYNFINDLDNLGVK